jgi:hypothetical protein
MPISSTLQSRRVTVELEAEKFNEALEGLGWGDGLPCIPPTEDLVRDYLGCVNRASDEVLGLLPPSGAACTVEAVAVNAVLAGAPAQSMPLLCAAVEAMSAPEFNLAGINATTASVSPAVFVNGPIRHSLRIPFGPSCFGGMRSSAPSIGRALRFVIRHVAGQVAGVTSESVFGQPARVVGLVAGEWEEESPWAPLAERRGVAGDAITVFGALGTANIIDTIGESGSDLLRVVGKSLGFMGAPGFLAATVFSEIAVAINPVWAGIIAKEFANIDEVRHILWDHAALPIDSFPSANQPGIDELGRVESDGRVHVVASPDDLLVLVCGGFGSLHSIMLHGFSHTLAVTLPVRP